MTNILAAVIMCLVTNVTEADNAWECSKCNPRGDYSGMTTLENHDLKTFPGSWPAIEKTLTTVVERVHTIKFTWRGKEMRGDDREEVSRTVRTFKKKEEWEEVE